MTRAGIYYHFSEKESLLLACLRRAASPARSPFASTCRSRDLGAFEHTVQRTPPAADAARHALRPQGDLPQHQLSQRRRPQSVCPPGAGVDPAEARSSYQGWIDEGRIRRIDTYFAERILTGMGHWYPIWFKTRTRLVCRAHVADHFARLFLSGLKPRRIRPESPHSRPAAIMLANWACSRGLGRRRFKWRPTNASSKSLLSGSNLRGISRYPEGFIAYNIIIPSSCPC